MIKVIKRAELAIIAFAASAGALPQTSPSSNSVAFGSNGLPIFNSLTGGIGQFVIINPPIELYAGPNQINQNCSILIPANIVASSPNLWGWFCVSLATLFVQRHKHKLSTTVAVLQPWKPGTSYSAIFDDGNGTTFEISVPSDLCPYTVLGDLESPQGSIMENATQSEIHDTLYALSTTDQGTYLSRILNNALNALQTELDALICTGPVGGARTLLWDLKFAKNFSGWLTGMPLWFGVAFGFYAWANGEGPLHVHYGWAEKDAILAAGTVVVTGLAIILGKLGTDGMFSDIDHWVAIQFAAVCSGFVTGLKKLGGGACTAAGVVSQTIGNLWNSCQGGLQAIGNPNDAGNPGVQMQPVGNNNPAQAAQPQAGPQPGPAGTIQPPVC